MFTVKRHVYRTWFIIWTCSGFCDHHLRSIRANFRFSSKAAFIAVFARVCLARAFDLSLKRTRMKGSGTQQIFLCSVSGQDTSKFSKFTMSKVLSGINRMNHTACCVWRKKTARKVFWAIKPDVVDILVPIISQNTEKTHMQVCFHAQCECFQFVYSLSAKLDDLRNFRESEKQTNTTHFSRRTAVRAFRFSRGA